MNEQTDLVPAVVVTARRRRMARGPMETMGKLYEGELAAAATSSKCRIARTEPNRRGLARSHVAKETRNGQG